MAIKFDGVGSAKLGLTPTNNKEAADLESSSNTKARTSANSPEDTVRISKNVENLKRLEADIQKAPDIDDDRVSRIKNALADGSYSIDTFALAGNLIDFENGLT